MSRLFSTTGRNSWATTNTRRCHQRDIYGELQPLDYPRERIPAWAWWSLAVVAAPFVASIIGGLAQ